MRRDRWLGRSLGILCAMIWGGQAVMTRLSVAQGLTPADVTLLRFAVGGLALAPLALRRQYRCKG
jgi:hypothetical protein